MIFSKFVIAISVICYFISYLAKEDETSFIALQIWVAAWMVITALPEKENKRG